MREDGRISLWQFFVLVLAFLIGSSTLIMPIGQARQDAWLAYLLAGVMGLIAAYFFTTLGRRFPGETPLQYTPRVLGRWLGGLFNLAYLCYSFFLAGLVLFNIAELYVEVVLPLTPPLVIVGTLTGLAAWSVRLGLEVLGRMAEFLVPLIVLGITALTALTFMTPGIVHLDFLLPVMERGPLPVLQGAYETFVFPFGEMVVFLVLIPFVTRPQESLKPFSAAIILATLFTAIAIVRNIVVLGVPELTRINFPSLIAVQLISVGEFLTRLEPLIIFIWTFSVFLKLAIVYYVFTLGSAQFLKLKDYRFLALPVAVLLSFFSLTLFENTFQLFQFATRAYPFFFMPFYFIYPAVVLAVAAVRNIKGEGA
ncbi:MAG: endospore germination permease [Clostridia bacterium]|nr:endospore germination permease [Clostridia bacterium]